MGGSTSEGGAPTGPSGAQDDVWPKLPPSLKRDVAGVRNLMLRRILMGKRSFWGAKHPRAIGGRSLGPGQVRGGQRVVVRALIGRHHGSGWARLAGLRGHFRYIGRDGVGPRGEGAEFFGPEADAVSPNAIAKAWMDDTLHYRLMISPEHGDCIADLRAYVRDVMRHVGRDLSEPRIPWVAVCHYNTDHPHAHVVMRGRREDGNALNISPRYLCAGVRGRAEEVASAELGDFSRGPQERWAWQETKVERFTALDRRLAQAADEKGLVTLPTDRSPTWRALLHARLRTLTALGLAEPLGAQYRIAPDLQWQLTTLELTKAQLRVINQRRLATGEPVHELRAGVLEGRTVEAGFHDQHGTAGYVILRDKAGAEHYARLALGQSAPEIGRFVEVQMTSKGAVYSAGLEAELR